MPVFSKKTGARFRFCSLKIVFKKIRKTAGENPISLIRSAISLSQEWVGQAWDKRGTRLGQILSSETRCSNLPMMFEKVVGQCGTAPVYNRLAFKAVPSLGYIGTEVGSNAVVILPILRAFSLGFPTPHRGP
jgi:hypothetical protein